MASILKVDKIRVSGGDSDSISFDGSGNITFNKTASGAGLNNVIIANDTTGGNGSTLEFDLSMDTSYLYQRFIIEGVYSSHSSDVYFQSRRASDDSYFTGSNSYAWSTFGYGNAYHGGNSSNGDTKARIVLHGSGDASTEKSMYIFDVYHNQVSGKQTHFIGTRTGWMSTPGITNENIVVTEMATTTTNRFKIYSSSGSSTMYYDGYVHYGIKRA